MLARRGEAGQGGLCAKGPIHAFALARSGAPP